MNESLPRFETLIETFHDEIYRYLWRMLNDASRSDAADEAHDLAQEVFLRAYRAYPRLHADSNVRAWLYKIATNCAYSAFEREGRKSGRAVPLLDEHDGVPDELDLQPDMQFLVEEKMGEIRAAIGELPAKQRAAFLMRYLHELEYTYIAEALNCSEDSARANVYQALKRLRSMLVEAA